MFARFAGRPVDGDPGVGKETAETTVLGYRGPERARGEKAGDRLRLRMEAPEQRDQGTLRGGCQQGVLVERVSGSA